MTEQSREHITTHLRAVAPTTIDATLRWCKRQLSETITASDVVEVVSLTSFFAVNALGEIEWK